MELFAGLTEELDRHRNARKLLTFELLRLRHLLEVRTSLRSLLFHSMPQHPAANSRLTCCQT